MDNPSSKKQVRESAARKQAISAGKQRAENRSNLNSHAVRRSVPLGKMHALSRHAQREKLNEAHVTGILAAFDLDHIGLPVLSERDDESFYILDGHHRVEALKRWLGEGWEDQEIACLVFSGLSEEEEAQKFRALNRRLAISPMDNFRTAVIAGEPDYCRVDALVRDIGLCISRANVPGAIGAVGTIMKIYRRSDGDTLSRALRIVRDAYGDAGLDAPIMDGIGALCQRYNGVLDEQQAVNALAQMHGGVKGLLGRAMTLHKSTGNQKAHCVAAAAVEEINRRSPRGRKLPPWWRA